MRDDLDQQFAGFGAELPPVAWASPTEIRRRGDRRRLVRTAATGAAAVLLVVTGVSTAMALGGGSAEPQPGASPQVSASAGVSDIPSTALLTPADIGAGVELMPGEVDDPRYDSVARCQSEGMWDGTPKAPVAGYAVRRTAAYRLDPARQTAEYTQWVGGYASAELAAQQLAHDRAGFEHCALLDMGGGFTHSFTISETGFAGDESLLVTFVVKMPDKPDRTFLYATFRVGAVYAVIHNREGTSPAEVRQLAVRAAERICATMAVC
ncbi:hypothetical protein [Catellatospora vulcania]|uniref:hypothetical protein n=1 Tax=Catellatospora vulcania TaxID=1460450 RepID=UPI0012D4B2E2|nr:hypothetical protein [Catellatospora vulcania]